MSYVDLHLHLLPGVDDGARDEAESLTFARRLVDEGVREVTVTPHVCAHLPLDVATIPARTARLQALFDREQLGLRLHPGGEIHPNRAASLTDAELEVIGQGPGDARWLLLEVPFAGIDERFIAICEQLRARGYALVIAHPERADGLLPHGWRLLRGQIGAGAVLQINVCSLLGNHGLRIQETAVWLLRNGFVCVLASDAHPGSREHTLRLGFDLAARAGASSVQAWRLTQANPRFLLRHGIPHTLARAQPGVELGAAA